MTDATDVRELSGEDESNEMLREASKTLFGTIDSRLEDMALRADTDTGELYAFHPDTNDVVRLSAVKETIEAEKIGGSEINQQELTFISGIRGGD